MNTTKEVEKLRKHAIERKIELRKLKEASDQRLPHLSGVSNVSVKKINLHRRPGSREKSANGKESKTIVAENVLNRLLQDTNRRKKAIEI